MPIEDSKKAKQRKSSRLETMREHNSKRGEAVEIDAVEPQAIGVAVQAVVLGGGAIFFGATADGGAVKITVYEGGEKEAHFVHSSEELAYLLQSIAVAWE